MANSLSRLRKQNDLSQEELAIKLDLSAGFISRVERGERKLSMQYALVAAAYFGVDISELADVYESDRGSHEITGKSRLPKGAPATVLGNLSSGTADLLPVKGYAYAKGIPEDPAKISDPEFAEHVIDRVQRPHGQIGVSDLFALRVAGQSMEPQFFNNDLIFIDVHLIAEPRQAVVVKEQWSDQQHPRYNLGVLKAKSDKGVTLLKRYPEPHDVTIEARYVKGIYRVLSTAALFGKPT